MNADAHGYDLINSTIHLNNVQPRSGGAHALSKPMVLAKNAICVHPFYPWLNSTCYVVKIAFNLRLIIISFKKPGIILSKRSKKRLAKPGIISFLPFNMPSMAIWAT